MIVLIIDETKSQLSKVKDRIQQINDEITQKMDKKMLDDLKTECEQYKSQMERELKIMKMDKFERDIEDYKSNKVYKWRYRGNTNPPRAPQRRPPSRRFETQSSFSSLDRDSDSSTYNDHTRPSFLGETSNRGGKKTSTRGRGRGKRSGEERANTQNGEPMHQTRSWRKKM